MNLNDVSFKLSGRHHKNLYANAHDNELDTQEFGKRTATTKLFFCKPVEDQLFEFSVLMRHITTPHTHQSVQSNPVRVISTGHALGDAAYVMLTKSMAERYTEA